MNTFIIAFPEHNDRLKLMNPATSDLESLASPYSIAQKSGNTQSRASA